MDKIVKDGEGYFSYKKVRRLLTMLKENNWTLEEFLEEIEKVPLPASSGKSAEDVLKLLRGRYAASGPLP